VTLAGRAGGSEGPRQVEDPGPDPVGEVLHPDPVHWSVEQDGFDLDPVTEFGEVVVGRGVPEGAAAHFEDFQQPETFIPFLAECGMRTIVVLMIGTARWRQGRICECPRMLELPS
jgi:hypothetical protein